LENLLNTISGFQVYITLGLALLVIILLIVVIVLLQSTNKLEKKYRRLMRGVNNKNLEELIIQYLDRVDEVKEDSNQLREVYDSMNNRIKECIQKVSIVRYRAFEDVGSDLSFSIALLSDDNSGAIITGIYGRNESTTYAKPIDKGISRYDLSEEEEEVLKVAMNK
jgi:hypothetical protein